MSSRRWSSPLGAPLSERREPVSFLSDSEENSEDGFGGRRDEHIDIRPMQITTNVISEESHEKMMESKEYMLEYVHTQNTQLRLRNEHMQKLLNASESALEQIQTAISQNSNMFLSKETKRYTKLGVMAHFYIEETNSCLQNLAQSITLYLGLAEINVHRTRQRPGGAPQDNINAANELVYSYKGHVQNGGNYNRNRAKRVVSQEEGS